MLAVQGVLQAFANSEIGSKSGLAQLDIATARFALWIGVKGVALASQLCIRKTFTNWTRDTVSAFLVAANLIISEDAKRFRFAPELAPGAKTTPHLFI